MNLTSAWPAGDSETSGGYANSVSSESKMALNGGYERSEGHTTELMRSSPGLCRSCSLLDMAHRSFPNDMAMSRYFRSSSIPLLWQPLCFQTQSRRGLILWVSSRRAADRPRSAAHWGRFQAQSRVFPRNRGHSSAALD
jgi:hypothetical protein